MKKRILPALLALCMVMAILPMAFAGNDTPTGNENETETKKPEVVTKEEYVSCAAVAAWAEKEGNNLPKDNADPHGKIKCALSSGCQCGIKTTVVTTPYDENGVNLDASKAETVVTYKYAAGPCDACTKNSTCNPCTANKNCTAVNHTKTDEDGKACPKKCYYCNNTAGNTEVNVDGQDAKVAICDTCAKSAAKNPCGTKGCTLVAGHTTKHNVLTCTKDELCHANKHEAECKVACAEGEGGVDGCTLTYDHGGFHNNASCEKVAGCGAAGKHTATEYDANGTVKTKGCPEFADCEVANCKLCAGHEGDHQARKVTITVTVKDETTGKDKEEEKEVDATLVCLGAKADGRCPGTTVKKEDGSTKTIHIAGCPKLCTCGTWSNSEFTATHEGCTHAPGCTACAKNEECKCPVCQTPADGAASGTVTDNDGEAVDPATPAEPSVPEVPVKAEDFIDIDAEDESQEWLVNAVQTVLDNGWMQGVGGSKFDAGTEASTGMVLTVVARMYGEEIEGADYAKLAKAWADENDLTEGIDLESDTITRQDIILLLWRLAGKKASDQELEFTDIEGIEGDYLTALKWAVEKGIVMGNGDGTVTPDGILNRGQLAALVARYADNVK